MLCQKGGQSFQRIRILVSLYPRDSCVVPAPAMEQPTTGLCAGCIRPRLHVHTAHVGGMYMTRKLGTKALTVGISKAGDKGVNKVDAGAS